MLVNLRIDKNSFYYFCASIGLKISHFSCQDYMKANPKSFKTFSRGGESCIKYGDAVTKQVGLGEKIYSMESRGTWIAYLGSSTNGSLGEIP